MLELIGLADAVLLETTRTPAEISATALATTARRRLGPRVTVGSRGADSLTLAVARPFEASVPIRLTWSTGDAGTTRLRVRMDTGEARSLGAHRAVHRVVAGLAEALDARAVPYSPAA